MASETNPFELEPEDDERRRKEQAEESVDDSQAEEASPLDSFELEEPSDDVSSPAPPSPTVVAQPRPEPTPPKTTRPPAVYVPRGVAAGAPPDELDESTVAERLGMDTPRGTERIPNPANWPQEVLSFPFGKPGPAFIALGVAVLFVLDLFGAVPAFLFPSWVAKLLLLVYLLRAQFRVIGTSAAGHDSPRGWRDALAFDRDELKHYWRTMLMFSGALAPGTLLFVFDHIGFGIFVLLVGSMYASVVAMGAALRDPALKWPWHAFAWMGARPLHCLVGSLAWWVLIGTELALHGLKGDGLVVIGFVSLALRFACLYLILACARVIGVMGRRWKPVAA